jgi:hypothetical protein
MRLLLRVHDNEAVMATMDDLMAALGEVIMLLDHADHPLRRDYMAKARVRLQRGDAYGLDNIVAAYGSMGSINDIIIGYRSVPVDKKDTAVSELREEIAELAQKQSGEISENEGR